MQIIWLDNVGETQGEKLINLSINYVFISSAHQSFHFTILLNFKILNTHLSKCSGRIKCTSPKRNLSRLDKAEEGRKEMKKTVVEFAERPLGGNVCFSKLAA